MWLDLELFRVLMTLIGPHSQIPNWEAYQKSVYSTEHNISATSAIGWFKVRGYIGTVIFQQSVSWTHTCITAEVQCIANKCNQHMNCRTRSPTKGESDLYVLPGTPCHYILCILCETDFMKILHRWVFNKSKSHLDSKTFKMVSTPLLKINTEP
jgi:hypothetical protein